MQLTALIKTMCATPEALKAQAFANKEWGEHGKMEIIVRAIHLCVF